MAKAKMANPRQVQSFQKPLTEKEKKIRIMQYLQQKREAFAINILNGLVSNMSKDASSKDATNMVELSIAMADSLLEKLYPIEEEKTIDEKSSVEETGK